MLKKILVTGASGFVGKYVIRNLLARNEFEIIATTRDLRKVSKFDFFSKVKFIEMDISNETSDLFANQNNLDAVIHLAWDGLPNYKELFHIEKNLFDHYKFCKKVVDAGINNLTVVGTCFEYGMVNGCLNENMNTKPNNSYAIAKDSLRKFIELLNQKKSFSFKWIRLFYMHGSGQAPNSLLSQLEKAISSGASEFNMSGGEQIRDYLHVSQVAENIVTCALQTKTAGIINCCSGVPISVRTIVEKYLKERNANLKLNLGYYPYADYEPMAFWGNNSKLKSILSKEKESQD